MENVYIFISTLFFKFEPTFSWHETERNAPYEPMQTYKFEGIDVTFAPQIYIRENQDCYSYYIECVLDREDLHKVCMIRPPEWYSWYRSDYDTVTNHCELDFINCNERGKRSGKDYRDNLYVYNGDGGRCEWSWRKGRTLKDNLRKLKDNYGYKLREEDLRRIYVDEVEFLSKAPSTMKTPKMKVENEPVYNSKTDPGFKRIKAILERLKENKLTGHE